MRPHARAPRRPAPLPRPPAGPRVPGQTCLVGRARSFLPEGRALPPEFSFRPCLGGSEAGEGRAEGAREPRPDAAGGSRGGVAGAGHVAVGGAAAGPAAPGRALGAAARRSGLDDPQQPARAAAAEAQRVLGPRARGPGLEAASRAGGQSGAPPAQVSPGAGAGARGGEADGAARACEGRRAPAGCGGGPRQGQLWSAFSELEPREVPGTQGVRGRTAGAGGRRPYTPFFLPSRPLCRS